MFISPFQSWVDFLKRISPVEAVIFIQDDYNLRELDLALKKVFAFERRTSLISENGPEK